ncbi:MAG: hypothetical protein PHI97_23040 [Desulfobulbus sp.]|nr:hypothetical protein [Desulfobulbus sp.]
MISEAGAGKTYECRKQTQSLWDAGEPAFFVELLALASTDLRSMLDEEEEARLDAWLSSQSDVATFFLDSIDELKLSRGSFEQALKRLKKVIGSQLRRARIVVTTRPIPFDEQLVRRVLPIPSVPSVEPKEETFAKIAMHNHVSQHAEDKEETADWRTVALMSLSDAQIVEFAGGQGVENPSALMDDLRKRNAQEFARRPQDLIELCADWREHKRIRTHRDQVAANVRVKLQPRDDRSEPTELSIDKAIEGAGRLALAMLVTRRLTIRHSAESDAIVGEAALDPAIILSDWNLNERKALLERPLFGFASYGRVRFHHRSVAEYLAAERLQALSKRSMPFRALKRLLFAETKGRIIVRPSKRPVAGWLALADDGIFEMLRDHEPAVLFDEGDPESLTQMQRNQAIRAYVERYGQGGWRGLSVPHIQIHRFASPELANEVNRLWDMGVENPDVRQTLLYLIETGRIVECVGIAHEVACDPKTSTVERVIALDALVALEDPKLQDIACAVAVGDALWPDEIARGAILRMFPRDLSVDQLCQALGWVKVRKRRVGDLNWQLPRLIENAELDPPSLEALRNGLVELVSDGLHWRKEWPHIVSDRLHLSSALAATCVRGLVVSRSDDWFHASVLALRLHHREYSNNDMHKALQERLTGLNAEENARLFWAEDSLMQSLHVVTDPCRRLTEVILLDGPVKLRAERDLIWIKEALGDTARAANDRAMLLEAAIHLPLNHEQWQDHVSGLKPLVADRADLLAVIDERLKPSKHDKEQKRWEKQEAERKKQRERKDAKNRASWIQFWREVAEHPESAFSSERSRSTAWNLWRAMSHDGEDSRASGWNRRFIEEQFGKETADRLRRALMHIWREEYPTLASERPEDARGTYLVFWQLGLAALYAEAEDPSWATKLTEKEAKLAARYAPIELNGLPRWMESLFNAHPAHVDAILGNELSWELESKPGAHGHSMLLQSISYAPGPVARIFLPRLETWLNANRDIVDDASDLTGAVERLRQVIGAMLKHGDEDVCAHLLAVARRRLQGSLPDKLIFAWLPTLMRIDPELGIAALEDRIRTIEPGERSEAVTWFSVLFSDRYDAINLRDAAFTPALLLRLLRLGYHHVRPDDDIEHEGSYSPGIRDDAERARNEIVSALFDAKGEEGWAAKLEMADDPLCAHFKDRILAVAEENWAQEIDSVAFDEAQAVALDKTGEAPASTNETMFAIMSDRLADLDDLLLRDSSPRDAWAGITDEKVMRREIARELNHAAKGLYKVDQEAVTADEKETDIRLRSVLSDHEAVIELKLADGRSARDLRDTIYNQLVKKYMAAENSRSGCLLITLAKNRRWEHPDSGQRVGLTELESLLRDEVKRVENAMGGSVALAVHILDLRPRLPKEKVRGTGDAST